MAQTDIIIEVAQAHDGSLGILHSYIDAVAQTGANAIKFQTHIAEAESSELEPFRVNFSYEDANRYDYWQRMEFSEEQWVGIKEHCDRVGLEFLSSPFSVAAVELLERLKVKRYKIASGEISNYLMLDRIACTGKPMMLSSGMSTWAELEETIHFLEPYGNELSLFQCTTAYPTKPDEIGLNVIDEMKDRFGLKVGLSDHSGTIYAALAAVARGAEMIELHVVFHHDMFGPDAMASLTPDQIRQMVEGIRFVEKALAHPIDKGKEIISTSVKTAFGKSLAVRNDLPIGHQIKLEDLESKKPGGQAIPAQDYQQVIGLYLSRALNKNSFLKREYLQAEPISQL